MLVIVSRRKELILHGVIPQDVELDNRYVYDSKNVVFMQVSGSPLSTRGLLGHYTGLSIIQTGVCI